MLARLLQYLRARACEQLAPWQRRLDGVVVGDGVYELIGIAVPSMIGTFLPESGTIEVGLSNAKERKRSDGQGNFKGEEADYNLGGAPLPWDRGEEGRHSHGDGDGDFNKLVD